MKKSNLTYVIIALISLSSCDNMYSEEKLYNTSGTLKSKRVFHGKNAKKPFLEINYFEDGVIKDSIRFNESGEKHGTIFQYDREAGTKIWDTYSNGIRHGLTWLSVRDSVFISQWYRKGKLNGIEKRYDYNLNLTDRILWIHGDILAYTKINKGIPGDTLWSTMITGSETIKTNRIISEYISIYSFYEKTPNGFINAGDLIFRKDGKIFDEKFQNYLIVRNEDTLLKNSLLNIEIEGLFGNLQKGYQLYVQLELTNNDNEQKITEELLSKPDHLIIQTSIDVSSTGYNLIMGRAILFTEENLISTYLFYEDFIVIEN